ncbi:hypothetical protein SAMN02910447_00557 [Ruminococcus sp. YE71]|uniref:hypothetical protein n=1 Tax=unclassified Ruminococcus TaxID=2608920 RepID=UPI000887A22D|nr:MULTISPECIES: hypothetical protein [unclassified Ruminococcus]SDA12217.1 hypothetical protein SAMN02910446_00556 [Ruminococcus sp. YE78]SFW16562.1 hypothetical protein SAMN02910447_00557 [Ruminococcus sp. YE71]
MKYLPILEELFRSDSCWFLLIGFAVGFAASGAVRLKRSAVRAAAVSAVVYGLCEVLLNVVGHNYMAELMGLFIGTTALGAGIAFAVRVFVLRTEGSAGLDGGNLSEERFSPVPPSEDF